MLDLKPSALCAYDGCPNEERLSTLIVERSDGQLERHVCGHHLWAAATITEQLDGLAYHLIRFQW